MGDEGSNTGGRDHPKVKPPVDLDQLFELLAHRQRRLLLYFLEDVEIASFDDCIAFVLEHDPDLTPGNDEHVRSSFVHHHLPKLEDGGLLEYDRRSETVRYRDDPIVATLLETAADHDL